MPSHASRKTSLGACLATAFAVAAPAAMATNRVVNNCNDGGSGSLRATVASALDGDTVDLSQLACSTITLTSGAILIGVNNLTLTAGPGAYSAITIDGGLSASHHNRVLSHQASGTLTIKGLLITDAKYDSGPSFEGGCIFSEGNVSLIASTVSSCTVVGAAADGNSVLGGGIYAAGNLSLLASTVSNNVAQATGPNNVARGGGIFSRGNVSALYSAVGNNSTVAAKIQGAYCGGICLQGNLDIGYSTISGNHAQVGGGIRLATLISRTAVISNSTISGNSSSDNALGSGGVYIQGASLTLSNSTIAFNNTANSNYAGGLQVDLGPVQLESSIIADNIAGGVASDFASSVPATGANNLIFHSSTTVPADTLLGICARLLPLADNGGGLLTHALRDTSPAIDKGNNVLALTYDERGQGFARVFGSTSDIGAYEWHGALADRVFNSGFELGCEE